MMTPAIGYRFGQSLVECEPFVYVVVNSQKHLYCDFCLKMLNETTRFPCDCAENVYCSHKCMMDDRPVHQDECRTGFLAKIKASLKETMENFATSSQNLFNNFDVTDYFELNDIVDYSLLFFRLLKRCRECDPFEFCCRFGGSINGDGGGTEYRFCWDQISTSVKFRDAPKSFAKPASEISHYLSRLDTLTDAELEEFDSLIELKMPKPEHFHQVVAQNDVKCFLKNLIDLVVLEDAEQNLPPDSPGYNMGSNFRSRKRTHSESTNEIPSNYSSQNTFDNEMESLFFYGSLPLRDQYQSKHLRFDKIILDKTETEAVKYLQMQYRLIHLEIIQRKYSAHESELDFFFGFWIDQLLRLLADVQIREHLGQIDYSEIEKAFYLTIRYAIAVQDSVGISTVGRALYMPLTKFNHSCIPNTSLVFDGRQLRMFHLPKNKLTPGERNAGAPKWINLNEITVDFNHETTTTTKSDSVNLYIFNKLRFLNCKCDRCCNSKKQVYTEIKKLFDEFGAQSETRDLYMGGEFGKDEFDDQYPMDYDQLGMEDQNRSIDYDFEFRLLTEANLKYGNRKELEYCCLIKDLLDEIIDSFRLIFGYYNRQTTMMLLFLSYCHLIVLASLQDAKEFFFKLISPLHRIIVELIDAIEITHGTGHKWITIVSAVHHDCHRLVQNWYVRYRAEIIQTMAHDLDTVQCQHLLDRDLLRRVQAIIERLESERRNNYSTADYSYNPYLSDDDDPTKDVGVMMMEKPSQCQSGDIDGPQDLHKIACRLNEIVDFFLFRYL